MNHTAKQVFVVIGMARTGMSLISRSLKALGICHGSSLVQAAEHWNPKGFWEDRDVVYGVHREIFATLHRKLYEVRFIAAEDQAPNNLVHAANAAMKLLHMRFAATDRYAFKDPATTRLLPFWKEIFKRLQIDAHYIITLRHPLACARSYQERLNCEFEIGLLLWCAYMVQAIDGTNQEKRVIIDYNQMLQFPREQLQRMATTFAIDQPQEDQAAAFAREFIESKLDRYGISDDESFNHPSLRVVDLCQDIYQLLLEVAVDNLDIDGDLFQSKWQAIKYAYAEVYPMHCYLEQLVANRNRLRRVLMNINKSWVWKLAAPLRWVDDALRNRRHQRHLKNRAVTHHA